MSASPTTQRDLPAGRSIRMARRDPSVTSAPLTCNISCDVVVTGSGISGSLIAEDLSDGGRRDP